MLKSQVRLLIRHKIRQPHFQTTRNLRRAPSRSPSRTRIKSNGSIERTTNQKQYINEFKEQIEKKGLKKVEIRRDLLLLDTLNDSRPGTKTDQRYKRQQRELEKLQNDDQKIQSLCHFLLNEIKLEIEQYPNPDNVSIDDSSSDPRQLEIMVEHELRRFFSSTLEKDGESGKDRKFHVLVTILESLRQKPGGALTFSPDFYSEVFQMAQFVEREDLKNKIRYVSGSLIYSLKKFEMDYLSESQFIESLILHNENTFAETLLLKRVEKIDQRWWYELMVVNYLDMGEISKSEEIVKLINGKFGEYLDIRVYQLFISKYIESQNFDKLKEWLIKLTDSIITNGFSDQKDIPGVGTTEEKALNYLNSEEPPTKEEYFEVLRLLLDVKEVPFEFPARMINLYLSVLPDDVGHVVETLMEYRHLYNFKVKPILQMVEERHTDLNISDYFKMYREVTPVESKNLDVLEEIINIETDIPALKQRLVEIQQSLTKDGEVTSTQMYNLLSGLLKSKKVEEAMKLLLAMEESKEKSRNLKDDEKLVIPEVSSKHYLPFMRYFGRREQLNDLIAILERYKIHHQFNPIILTQLLNSLSKMRRYDLALIYIEQILMNDIHLGDREYSSINMSSRELYSTIWKTIKDMLIEVSNLKRNHDAKSQQIESLLIDKLPNLRYLFMKMIHEKVIPSSHDYFNIISTFFISRDRPAVLCAMEYLNNKHNLQLSEKTIKIVDKYCSFPNEIGYFKYLENKEQQERLNQLHFESSSATSFDPFNPVSKADELNDESLLDLKTPEEEIEAEKSENIKKLVWLNSFKRIYQSLDKTIITNNDLKSAHNDFELSYHDFEQLVNNWD